MPLWSIQRTHISHFLGQFHFIAACFLIGGKLPYNVVLVSAIQQGESVIIIQISLHSWASFLKRHIYPNVHWSTIYNCQDNSGLCPWYIFTPKVFPVGKINYVITLVIYQIYENLICNGKRVPKKSFWFFGDNVSKLMFCLLMQVEVTWVYLTSEHVYAERCTFVISRKLFCIYTIHQ